MAKIIDLTGQTFGMWKVLNKTDQRGADRSVMWNCECLGCGKTFLLNGSNLRNGHSSQGCRSCISKSIKRKGKDITNQKFGLLTALEPTDLRKYGTIVWKCKCDCGNICYVDVPSLTSGGTQSCGCLVSRGENKITNILKLANIPFETQKKFKDCKDKDCLKFDFYVNNKYLIEFDGAQHFSWGRCWNGEHKQDILRRDQIKNQYCLEHNIPLIRIPYWILDNLTLQDLQIETTKYLLKE